MAHYIDGFVHPVPRVHLDTYKHVAKHVADIWKEYGALAYLEYVGDDMSLSGTRSFGPAVDAGEDEVILFGWVLFESRKSRDEANKLVASDDRMRVLMEPLSGSNRTIFDASRMLYGGFEAFIQ